MGTGMGTGKGSGVMTMSRESSSESSSDKGCDGERSVSVVSWTGGKDGCLAAYRAICEGRRIGHLLSFWNMTRQGAHEVNPGLLSAQAEAMGIPLVRTGFSSYEEEFKRVVQSLNQSRKENGEGEKIGSAVFGHIQTHDRLVERICGDLGIELLMPLWMMDSAEIINELIDSGFEVVLVGVKADLFGQEWLGRRIDESFLADLRALDSSIDPCGEDGEFHTLVLDGPIFNQRIRITRSEPTLRGDLRFLDILEFAVEDKQ
ncbi:MAG TPA: diphthine--ammonia ligase [Methanothrix sp.]|nr:diphthine--ammonia ligase [Methanothrix sp.]